MGAKVVDGVGLVDHCLNAQCEEFLHLARRDLFVEDNDLGPFRLRDLSKGSAELHDFLPFRNRPEDHEVRLQQTDLDPALVEIPRHDDFMGVGGTP